MEKCLIKGRAALINTVGAEGLFSRLFEELLITNLASEKVYCAFGTKTPITLHKSNVHIYYVRENTLPFLTLMELCSFPVAQD